MDPAIVHIESDKRPEWRKLYQISKSQLSHSWTGELLSAVNVNAIQETPPGRSKISCRAS